MKWILFYYNSLPEMPKKCFLFSSDIMHRDFFKCNPTNTGHYQYPKFETLSYDTGCHRREVEHFLTKSDPDKYVIFYTRYTPLKGKSKNKIVGYFKVPKKLKSSKGFQSSESVLLPAKECININYSERGVPVSWGHSSIKDNVSRIFKNLRAIRHTKKNIALRYKGETRRIMKLLQSAAGRREVLKKCLQCKIKEKTEKCHWWKMKDKEETLRDLYSEKKTC